MPSLFYQEAQRRLTDEQLRQIIRLSQRVTDCAIEAYNDGCHHASRQQLALAATYLQDALDYLTGER